MHHHVQHRVFASVWISYFTLCILAFIWPLATVANSIEPKVAGLPFLFVWFLIWVGLIFVGGLVMYLWDARLNRGVTENE